MQEGNFNKKLYLRQYRIKNRDKINEYNRLWMQNYRRKQKNSNKVEFDEYENKNYNEKWICKRKGFCERCGIKLTSKYTSIGNNEYCGECLELLGDNFNDKI